MASPSDKPTLMRSLGAFFGHVWAGVKADPAARPDAARQVVREDVEERQQPLPDGSGSVTLRRTTTEEIIVRRNPPTA